MDLIAHQTAGRRKADRRSDRRYPIDAELVYQLVRHGQAVETGHGRTLNVSSSGILFEAACALPRGAPIELSIAWPARLGDVVALKLCVTGRTVRCQNNCTAVLIQRHIFRTKGTREVVAGRGGK
jgi:hypothetical protein